MKKVLIILTILFSNFAYSQEDILEKGIKAYESGDYSIALKYFQQACSLNNDLGCYELGLMYDTGLSVKEDKTKATEFYKKNL
ncbi:SEL1-like repeat protein [Campylobacter peloridis]|uniref:sel1 repeat family protein n=1 Tax=Campylobacter peloridis TaxID=488546 RepID=UPI0021C3A5D1|nr:sel1 repeat family protein [Campylobacter peloridis]